MRLAIIIMSLITRGYAVLSTIEGELQSLHNRDIYDNEIEDEPVYCNPKQKMLPCNGHPDCKESTPDYVNIWAKYLKHGGSMSCEETYQNPWLKFPWKWGTLAHNSDACRRDPQYDTCGTDLYCKGFGQNGQFVSQRTPRFRSREQCLRAHEAAPAKLPWEDGYGRPDSIQCRENPIEKQCGSLIYCAAFDAAAGQGGRRFTDYQTSDECLNAREKSPHAKEIEPKRKWEDGTPAGRRACGISAFTAEECGTARYCHLFPTTLPGIDDDFAATDECEAAFAPKTLESTLDFNTYNFLQCIVNKEGKQCGTQIYCDMVGTGEVQDDIWKTNEECLRGHPDLKANGSTDK
ncbi:hypothetical protein VFPFJ_11122 [Purpureocillium lilacinum]|uniref:Uncharacterized protein n=1 Tax=Purpureocillium lilacinum TaxID=33203 RepID=A0A179FR15_PURLI|nr:hypothetical protein VFPFJ_11122 [Purpureocillium lilacinum]OAQ67533.1 hypothetical protein VFPFJ_11122 [Purpureocillium lilacinum]